MAAFVMMAALVVVPRDGAAQTDPESCYPDGCSTTTTTAPGSTTTAPQADPTCGLSLEAGPVGAEVVATVSNVPVGGTVRLLLDGNEVARGDHQGVGSTAAVPMQSTGDVVMRFSVPDLGPGDYSVVAVGVGFTIVCGGGGLEVLGASAGTGDGTGGGKDGALAFTGAQIFWFVLVALLLLAIGYAMVRRSRQRRLA